MVEHNPKPGVTTQMKIIIDIPTQNREQVSALYEAGIDIRLAETARIVAASRQATHNLQPCVAGLSQEDEKRLPEIKGYIGPIK